MLAYMSVTTRNRAACTKTAPSEVNETKRRYVREKQLEAETGINCRTLQRWRLFGDGPPYYKRNRLVLYDLDEVLNWIRAGRAGGAAA